MTEEEFRRLRRLPAANSCYRDCGVSQVERRAISDELRSVIDKANSKVSPPLEDQEQEALVVWLRQRGVRHHATPNGGHRRKATAGKLKAQGVVSGVPDLTVWPKSESRLPVLWIELKRRRGGHASTAQQEWIDYINTLPGHAAMVCRGFDEARDFILSWGY